MKHKICMIGEISVGKTSLTRRFVKSVFDEQYKTTVGVNISTKEVLREDKAQKLIIWDLAGTTQGKGILPQYMAGSQGAFLVVDCTRIESIQYIFSYLESFKKLNPKSPYELLVNKVDLERAPGVSEAVRELENASGASAKWTSAKSGVGVEKAFFDLGTRIIHSI